MLIAVLALVVGGAAAVPAAVALDDLPGREPRLPAAHPGRGSRRHGRSRARSAAPSPSMRSANRNGPRAFGWRSTRQVKPSASNAGFISASTIAREVGGALRVLALGRDRDAARQIGLERAGVEILRGAGDGGFTAHTAIMIRTSSPWQPPGLPNTPRQPKLLPCAAVVAGQAEIAAHCHQAEGPYEAFRMPELRAVALFREHPLRELRHRGSAICPRARP